MKKWKIESGIAVNYMCELINNSTFHSPHSTLIKQCASTTEPTTVNMITTVG